MAPRMRASLAVMVLLGCSPETVADRGGDDAALPPVEEPMPLYDASVLGSFSRTVTTDSADAQAYFTQGIVLMYAFTPANAVNAFREAEQRDPDCAMCYWGEAWTLGPYLNAKMDGDDVPRAYEVIQWAGGLAESHASPVERRLIEAMAQRYEPVHDSAGRIRLDSAYANAMADVYRDYPNDLDVGVLYAESLMLLEPRRGAWDIDKPAVRRIHQVLEAVLTQDIRHPGACHFYIHATEPTSEPGKSEACAEYLGDAIPGASHVVHMPSHVYNRIGRWDDAVRANIKAYHTDQRAAWDQGFAIYPSHNLHMLVFSASNAGQGAIAILAGKDYGKLESDGAGAFYEALALLRFGRFDDILELDDPPTDAIPLGLWRFARGYAHLKQGQPDSARSYLAMMEAAIGTTPDTVRFRGHPAESLLGVTAGILSGELGWQEGRLDEAIVTFEEAVVLEDQIRYDEPEPLNFSARDWLGAALLEADRPADAEQVYRAALEDHPNNGWSLFGLEQALRAQGREREADEVGFRYAESWAMADALLRASRF